MKRWHVLAGMALALAGPAMAQPAKNDRAASAEAKTEAEAVAAIGKLFSVEPLTAEQRARLPQAEALIAQIMPPGTLEQVMSGMYESLLGPLTAMAGAPDSAQIASALGIEDEDFALEDEEVQQIAAILDPMWKERGERAMKALNSAMGKALRAMEPAMRKGMAEAYAATFTPAEMTDVAAFFATPSGASYARKSYALASDPRIMAASMEALPAMISEMKSMEAEVEAATAGLPPRRGFGDLTPTERATLARLTGRSPAQLRDGMARADEADADHNDQT